MYRFFRNMAILLVFFTASCATDGSVAPTEPEDPSGPTEPTSPGIEYTLELEHTDGVIGTLFIGNSTYKEGQVVSYNFTQDFGYKNLLVKIDDVNAPSSGSVTMDKNRKISVSAEPEPELPDGGVEARSIMNNVLGYYQASSPASIVTAYNSHLGQVDDVYGADPENARVSILAGYREALKRVSDEQLLAVEQALSAKLFGPNMSLGSSLRFANSVSGVTNTALIYVNGILNSSDAASVSRKELELVVEEAGLGSDIKVYNFYNASGMYNTTVQDRCIRRAAGLRSRIRYALCNGIVLDITQSSMQIANLLGTMPIEASTETEALARVIEEERALGRRVILVGHSQGNLMIQEALGELPDKSCVRSLSIAGPLGKSSWQTEMSDDQFDGLVVAGERTQDIILYLGKNDFKKVSTDITRLADERVVNLENQDLSVALGGYTEVDAMLEGVLLHSMGESYLAGVESRDEIRQSITGLYESMDQSGACARSIGAQFYASTAFTSSNGTVSYPSALVLVPLSPSAPTNTFIGLFESAGNEKPVITDIALSPNGELYGVSFDNLYRIDKGTAEVEFVTSFTNFPGINSLSFDNQGFLYLANVEGTIAAMDISNMSINWAGDFNLGVGSAGDIAFSPSGDLYAVIVTAEGANVLARVDLSSGQATAMGQSIGFKNVWGITFVGDALYGLSADLDNRALISIDKNSGMGTFIRGLSFSPTGAALKER